MVLNGWRPPHPDRRSGGTGVQRKASSGHGTATGDLPVPRPVVRGGNPPGYRNNPTCGACEDSACSAQFGCVGSACFALVALVARIEPGGVLLPVVFRGTSLRFAKGFRVTHHLPTLFTAKYGGITTQFWARYTRHLPFDYLPGKRPAQPPDGSPERFDPGLHLRDADWVLLEQADDDVGPERRIDSDRVRRDLAAHADCVATEGLWRLYRVTR